RRAGWRQRGTQRGPGRGGVPRMATPPGPHRRSAAAHLAHQNPRRRRRRSRRRAPARCRPGDSRRAGGGVRPLRAGHSPGIRLGVRGGISRRPVAGIASVPRTRAHLSSARVHRARTPGPCEPATRAGNPYRIRNTAELTDPLEAWVYFLCHGAELDTDALPTALRSAKTTPPRRGKLSTGGAVSHPSRSTPPALFDGGVQLHLVVVVVVAEELERLGRGARDADDLHLDAALRLEPADLLPLAVEQVVRHLRRHL